MPDSNLLARRSRAHAALDFLKDKVTRETESYDVPTDITQRLRQKLPETAEGCRAMCSEVMTLLDTRSWGETIELLERMTARDL